ncbi:MAG: hypothetical protein ACOYEP_05330 [Limnochordia bacterium]
MLERLVFMAALVGTLICLLCGHTLADSPAWFSLVRPRQTFVTYTCGVGTAYSEHSYAEIGSRLVSRLVEYSGGIQVLGYPLDTPHHALLLEAKISQAKERSTLFTWTPEGPASGSLTRHTGLVPRLRLAWQYEAVSPLWRHGLEVGCTLRSDSGRASCPEVSVWAARVYEPAVLSLTVTQGGRETTAIKAGVETVLNRRLALGTAFVWVQPTDKDGITETSVEMAATIRQSDQTGWSLIVTWGRQAQGVTLGRNLPLR